MTLRWVGRIAILDPTQDTWETVRVGRSPHGIFFKPRRDGVGADFALSMAGATSGSRPLVTPLPRRPASAAPEPAGLRPGAVPPAPAIPAVLRRTP
jgi:hypothetical protein